MVCITALGKKAARIVAFGQHDRTHIDALLSEPADKRLRRFLTAAIRIRIKGKVDGAWAVTELPVLVQVELIPHGAGDVMKTGLP